MGVRFHCDAPGCAQRLRDHLGLDCCDPDEEMSAPARTTALTVPGLRDRENPADSPVIYLPPIGWTRVAMRDGRSLYACSSECRDELEGKEGRDGTGRRIGATCPACGQGVSG